MRLINEAITVVWEITNNGDDLLRAIDFDVVLISPEGVSTFEDAPMTNFIVPIPPAKGSMTYTFTPNFPGRWEVQLVNSDSVSDVYTILDTFKTDLVCELHDYSPLLIRPVQPATGYQAPYCVGPYAASNFSDMYIIHGLGRGGPNNQTIVVAGTGNITAGNGRHYLMRTDTIFSEETVLIELDQLPGWVGFATHPQIRWIQYAAKLDIWVFFTDDGIGWWSRDLILFYKCTIQPEIDGGDQWRDINQDVTNLHWNPTLEYFSCGSARNISIISKTGAHWVDQATEASIQGGRRWEGTLAFSGDIYHIITGTGENYYYKTSHNKTMSGWTHIGTGGIYGGTGGTWDMPFWVAAGGNSDVVVARFDHISITNLIEDGLAIPNSWSDGSGDGYNATSLGIPSGGGDWRWFGYHPEFDRPWVACFDESGPGGIAWYDAEVCTKAGHNFQLSTNPVFTALGVDKPKSQEVSAGVHGSGKYYDPKSVWGATGWWMIMEPNGSQGTALIPEYIIMNPGV